MEKQPFLPGGYRRIGEIPHGQLWPDWGLYRVKSNINGNMMKKHICILSLGKMCRNF